LIKLMFKLKQKKINNKKLKRNNNIVDWEMIVFILNWNKENSEVRFVQF
jgi:hypothetical protein